MTPEETAEAVARKLLGDHPLYSCQNCTFVTAFWEELRQPIKRYWERVGANEREPAGECPHCGALCHADYRDRS